MGRINIVLDLDNTLVSSISFKELKKIKNMDKRRLKYKDMDEYYRIYYRPFLKEFLEYVFKNFDVTIWTAASRDYASFILDNIILNENDKKHKKGKKKLKMFLFDQNCDQSQILYDQDSPKDLRYLYNFPGYHQCNTIIVDDLLEVYNANKNKTIRAPYFDAKKEISENDTFLLDIIDKLKELKKSKCTNHV